MQHVLQILKVLGDSSNYTLVRPLCGFAAVSLSNILLRSKKLLVRLNDLHSKQWLADKLNLPVLYIGKL